MKADVLVVGGGPAGAAAAIGLARAGREVVVLERAHAPEHKVCGEFLSIETLAMLQKLGADVWGLGAERIARVRLAGGAKVSEAELPFVAGSLTRKRLDEALLAAAKDAGAVVLRGVNVEALGKFKNGWCATVSQTAKTETDGRGKQDEIIGKVLAPDAVLASGKHDVRGRARPDGEQDDLVAFKQYWKLSHAQTVALRGSVELLLFADGYGGLQLVEGGCANLCWVIRRTRVQGLRGDTAAMLSEMREQCALLNERMKGASAQMPKPLAVSGIPYGMVRRETKSRLWCVGDQAAVIPSFTGDGMAIALHSGMLAAEMMTRGQDASAFQQELAAEVEQQVRFATRLSRWTARTPVQHAAVRAAGWFPGMMPLIARHTRLRVR